MLKIQTQGMGENVRRLAAAFLAVAIFVGVVSILNHNADAAGETIGGSSSHSARVNQQLGISDIVINGTGNDIVPIKVTVSQGTIYMTTTTGLTFSGTNNASTLSFSGTRSNVNAALATLHYANPSVGTQTLTVSLADSNTIFNPTNNHVYQYVPGSINWYDARDAAAASHYAGITGYLATITSQNENDFIKDRLNGDAWLGGSDDDLYGGEGHWNWISGPEAGTNIYNGQGAGGAGNGVAVSGQYNNWAPGEPNQAGDEDCMETYIADGSWNDLPCTATVSGYVVEYGDVGHTPPAIPTKDITLTTTTASFSGGNGSVGAPYQITDCERLQDLNQNLSAHYVMTHNIDCTETTGWNAGKGFVPIGGDGSPFTGTFDAQGYTIDGLYINRADDDPNTDFFSDPGTNEQYVGLFGFAQGATIQNLHITNAKVKGWQYVGGIIGMMDGGTLTNTTFNIGVADNSCNPGLCVWARYGHEGGGLVGHLENGTVSNSHTAGPVKGSGMIIGGLVGQMNGGTLEDSSSSSNADGGTFIGGAIGEMIGGTATRVHASGSIDTNTLEGFKDGKYGGGFVGALEGGVISQSYATGNVSVEVESGGGFAGVLFSSSANSITDSYATGDVSSTSGYGYNMGGFVGEMYEGAIHRAYASGSVSADSNAGGFAGAIYNSSTVSDSFAAGSTTSNSGTAGFFVDNQQQSAVFSHNFYDITGTGQSDCGGGVTTECTGIDDNGSDSKYLMNYTKSPFTQSSSRVWNENVWYFDGVHHPVLRMGTNSTASVQPFVDDNDGVNAAVENAGPNGGDGNHDGIQDSQQANVTSFVNPETGKYVTLEVDSVCDVTTIANTAESTNIAADGDYTYPQGLLHYTVDCGTPGYSTDVAIYYDGITNANGMVVRKYNSTTKTYSMIPSAVITGSNPLKVSYAITDGGSLDEDGTPDGVIVDPVGLASRDMLIPGVPNTGVGRIVQSLAPLAIIISLAAVTVGVITVIWQDSQKRRS